MRKYQIITGIVVIVLLAAGVGGYIFMRNEQAKNAAAAKVEEERKQKLAEWQESVDMWSEEDMKSGEAMQPEDKPVQNVAETEPTQELPAPTSPAVTDMPDELPKTGMSGSLFGMTFIASVVAYAACFAYQIRNRFSA